MRDLIARLAQSNLVHVLAAFLLMGGWATFANSGHAMPKPLIAGLVQGCLSASITLFLKRLIEIVAARTHGKMALVLPPALAMIASFSLLTIAHTLAGTPEVWLTIALPFSAATFYSISYNFAVWKMREPV